MVLKMKDGYLRQQAERLNSLSQFFKIKHITLNTQHFIFIASDPSRYVPKRSQRQFHPSVPPACRRLHHRPRRPFDAAGPMASAVFLLVMTLGGGLQAVHGLVGCRS